MAIDNPPPYHSGMTTLDPATETALLELIEANLHRPGLGMKDSFHCLDLAARGLIEHFAATAIRSDARQAEDTIGWHRKISGDDLELWETAWKAGGSSSGTCRTAGTRS